MTGDLRDTYSEPSARSEELDDPTEDARVEGNAAQIDHVTKAPPPWRPMQSPSRRPRQTRQPTDRTAPTGSRDQPSDADRASRPRIEGRRILAEALAVVPGAIAGAFIVVYLAWWGAEMGSRVPRGHALLLGLLGCVVVSIAAVVLGLCGVGHRGPSRLSQPSARSRNSVFDSSPMPPDRNPADGAAPQYAEEEVATPSGVGATTDQTDPEPGNPGPPGRKEDQPDGGRSHANNSPGGQRRRMDHRITS